MIYTIQSQDLFPWRWLPATLLFKSKIYTKERGNQWFATRSWPSVKMTFECLALTVTQEFESLKVVLSTDVLHQ